MTPEPSWESLDWAALDRLRDQFLRGVPSEASYWSSPSDLANYDYTFAQRIGWKWDAVLRELRQRGWTPPAGEMLDWGCGSGIAGRRTVSFFDEGTFTRLRLFDRSTLAMEFAEAVARRSFPKLRVERASTGWLTDGEPVGLLLISHVLNELAETERQILRGLIDRAAAVLWVEPGTRVMSRELIAWREALRESFHAVAPCTHQAACGLLSPENERHWCHHFARPPAGILGDANWVRFARRAGIDLRSIPYSFLVLERKGLRESAAGFLPEGWSHIIGEPRVYKGYARILSCQQDGVRELRLQKRAQPELFRALKDGSAGSTYSWRIEGADILSGREPPR